jgi:hypothetical protein
LRLGGPAPPEIARQVGRTERLARLVLADLARTFQHRPEAHQ